MKEHLISCPLCHGEIPFDAPQCSYCGVLLSPGPARGSPILKGMVCRRCGSRSYNYDYCDQCEQPFAKVCPHCGATMALLDHTCPACGESMRRFTAQRKRESEAAPPRFLRLPRSWPVRLALVAAVVLAALAVVTLLTRPRPKPVIDKTHKPGDIEAIDSEGRGRPDRWDVYGPGGAVVERRFDLNHNGRVNRIEQLDAAGKPRTARADVDGDGFFERLEVFGPDGVVRVAYTYAPKTYDFPRKIEFFNALGKPSEVWSDDEGRGAWSRYQHFDATGRLFIEGTDTQKKGWIDLYLLYRPGQKIFQRWYDLKGDGIIAKIETLNRDGVRIAVEEDATGNGLFDKRTLFNLAGKIRWEEIDTNHDGVYDLFHSFTKDGLLARTGVDTKGDGAPDAWK
jgi:hypothetical protein